MKITGIKLHLVRSGDTGGAARHPAKASTGAADGRRNAHQQPHEHLSQVRHQRTLWMGPGQDPYVIEIETDEGVTGFCANYGGGAFACAVIDQHFRRFLIGSDPFDIDSSGTR